MMTDDELFNYYKSDIMDVGDNEIVKITKEMAKIDNIFHCLNYIPEFDCYGFYIIDLKDTHCYCYDYRHSLKCNAWCCHNVEELKETIKKKLNEVRKH